VQRVQCHVREIAVNRGLGALHRHAPEPAAPHSCHTVGRHDATLRGGVSAHCCHIRRRPFHTNFAHCPHLSGTKQAPVFSHGLAPSFARSCWTHGRKQAVPTAFGTFFELASSSSKNVAADRITGRFCGQRRMGTTRVKAASSTEYLLRTCCGHGPRCRHARRWITVRSMNFIRMALPTLHRG
jgi:hypothetical protein